MKTIAAFLLFAAVAIAEDKPVKNPLTPKEIADGWLLLFDGDSTFGWDHQGYVAVDDGKLSLGDANIAKANVEFLPYGSLLTTSDGKPIQSNIQPGPFTLESTAGKPLVIQALKYKPMDLEPIFNGKDLSGWKVFTGDAKKNISKWEVTKEGEIHLSNGPGDLQTEKQYKDFLVQLECKTNGPALNSGLFFRCLENQYQQGYECQIQNGIKDGDRTKPADFGTGAIYRRVPARTVVSNDHEWFTMTVLAVGPHIRTWVNGYPVVSWTDDRKPAENARNGQYLKAGHLSLQGHDKTTDILFRNIRIVEIK